MSLKAPIVLLVKLEVIKKHLDIAIRLARFFHKFIHCC